MGDARLPLLAAAFNAPTTCAKTSQRARSCVATPEDEDLVADGDAAVARFNDTVTLPDGNTTTVRAIAFHRLADDGIVVNDVMFDPDLMSVLGPLMAPPPDEQSSTALVGRGFESHTAHEHALNKRFRESSVGASRPWPSGMAVARRPGECLGVHVCDGDTEVGGRDRLPLPICSSAAVAAQCVVSARSPGNPRTRGHL